MSNPLIPEDDAFPVPDPPIKGGFSETVEIDAVEEDFPVPDPPIKGS